MNADDIRDDLDNSLASSSGSKFARFLLACISGALPVYGGVVGGAGAAWGEHEQERLNKLIASWLKIHEAELKEIGVTLMEVMMRLDAEDEEIRRRIESPEYLSILRKCFRDWSAAESEMKRSLIRNLLVHAAHPHRVANDDIIKLFVKWIDDYSEEHFKVIGAVYQKPGSTRADIWHKVYGTVPRDDSAEADLFRLIIHDLSVGRVARQHREADGHGRFLKQPKRPQPGRSSPHMTSAFDDDKEYELTELGKQFVHFTMDELVPRLPRETPI